ncbi:MAG TPA: hypothetical protein DEO57_04790 [Phycisphaerales bacterium]|nr:hypothetical protein [Phycisphaerales bacterium]
MKVVPTASQRCVLPASLLRDGETVLRVLRPHPLFIPLVSLPACTVLLVIVLLVVLSGAMLPGGGVAGQAWWTFGLLVLLRLGWAVLQWFNELYILTDDRLMTRSGVIRVRVYETSLRHLRQTLVRVSLRERIFGLGTVLAATAATAVYDTAWVMLRHPVAVQSAIQDAMSDRGVASGG